MVTGRKQPTPGNCRNKWTSKQRLTLHLLHSSFDLAPDQRTRIFNTIFADHLRQCGLPDGLQNTGISAQYAERNKKDRAPAMAIWKPILAGPSSFEERGEWEVIVEEIAQLVRTVPGAKVRAGPPVGENIRNDHDTMATLAEGTMSTHRAKEMKRDHSTTFPALQPFADGIDFENSDSEYSPFPESKRVRRFAQTVTHTTPSSGLRTRGDAGRSSHDGDHEVYTPASMQARTIRTSPASVIPTPSRTQVRPCESVARLLPLQERATQWYPRPNGGIWITPRKYEDALKDLTPPTESNVHPPLAGLLFRYWTDDCQSKLNDSGEFVASHFSSLALPVPTVPNPQYPEWWWAVGHHMNRDQIPSPFISACSDLAWSLRLAVGERKKGATSGRITVIDAHRVDRRAIFHAQAFHRELCKKMIFDKGAWHYQGKREFIVYGKIPSAAVVHTFQVDDIVQLEASTPAVGALLRLNQSSAKGQGLASTVLPTLRAHNYKLSETAVTAMAQVVLFLHIEPDSTEQIVHIVSDLIQGWAVAVDYHSPEQWSQKADVFASAMRGSTTRLKDSQSTKLAFLDGVRWSRGADCSTRHKVESMRVMLSRAKKIGLEDPARILCDELDAAKLALMLYDKKQQRLLQGEAYRALPSIGGEEDEETLPITPRSGELDDEILYDDD